MISYAPFYETLFRKGLTEYYLIYKQGIPANTLHRMKHGYPISTRTLDTLCFILDCRVEDVLRYEPDERQSKEIISHPEDGVEKQSDSE